MTFLAAVFGAGAALLATAFSGWQAYLLRQQLMRTDQMDRAGFYQTVTQAFSELNRMFVDNPELRPYFYEGREPADGDDLLRQRLLAMAGYIADAAESCTAAESVLPGLKGDWDDYFNFLYRNSPALRAWWAAMGHLYPEEVRRIIRGPSLRPKEWPVGCASPMQSRTEEGRGTAGKLRLRIPKVSFHQFRRPSDRVAG